MIFCMQGFSCSHQVNAFLKCFGCCYWSASLLKCRAPLYQGLGGILKFEAFLVLCWCISLCIIIMSVTIVSVLKCIWQELLKDTSTPRTCLFFTTILTFNIFSLYLVENNTQFFKIKTCNFCNLK